MTRRLLLLTSLLAVTLSLTSCRIPSSGITVESYPRTKITKNAAMVSRRIQITEYTALQKNGILQVQITMHNKKRRACQFEYRFEWKDGDGMVVDTPMKTWIPVVINAQESKPMVGMAPSKDVEDFTFIVRFARPSIRW